MFACLYIPLLCCSTSPYHAQGEGYRSRGNLQNKYLLEDEWLFNKIMHATDELITLILEVMN